MLRGITQRCGAQHLARSVATCSANGTNALSRYRMVRGCLADTNGTQHAACNTQHAPQNGATRNVKTQRCNTERCQRGCAARTVDQRLHFEQCLRHCCSDADALAQGSQDAAIRYGARISSHMLAPCLGRAHTCNNGNGRMDARTHARTQAGASAAHAHSPQHNAWRSRHAEARTRCTAVAVEPSGAYASGSSCCGAAKTARIRRRRRAAKGRGTSGTPRRRLLRTDRCGKGGLAGTAAEGWTGVRVHQAAANCT